MYTSCKLKFKRVVSKFSTFFKYIGTNDTTVLHDSNKFKKYEGIKDD